MPYKSIIDFLIYHSNTLCFFFDNEQAILSIKMTLAHIKKKTIIIFNDALKDIHTMKIGI